MCLNLIIRFKKQVLRWQGSWFASTTSDDVAAGVALLLFGVEEGVARAGHAGGEAAVAGVEVVVAAESVETVGKLVVAAEEIRRGGRVHLSKMCIR